MAALEPSARAELPAAIPDARVADQRGAASLAALALLAAVAAGLLGQGAYYPPVQRIVGVLLAAAAALALIGSPPRRGEVRALALPAAALGMWGLLDAALLGTPTGPAVRLMLLLLGLVAVVSVCRRVSTQDRQLLHHGVTAVGLLVAMTGWLGVAGRMGAWAWLGDGIWRASSTVSYPNATAAVLVVVAVSVLARLTETPRHIPSLLAATALLVGAGATMSRAGALGLAVGLIVLAVLRGVRRTARAAAGPAAGALLAGACLLPSMPAIGPARPALAAAGLLGGLALAVVVARLRRWPAAAVLLGVLALAGLGLLLAGGRGSGGALAAVFHARANLASPDRAGALHAAIGVIQAHPVTGAGPGHTDLRWEGPDGVHHFFAYAHNEYVQTTADLGLVGAALLAVLLAALARLLWSARAATGRSAASAGAVGAMAAFAVHSSFDFIWHLPAVVLAVLLIAGAVLPEPAGTGHPGASRPTRRENDEIQVTK